jgi:hypothetical protein
VPLNRRDAVDAARSILDGPRASERQRLNRISAALKPNHPSLSLPPGAPVAMRNLATKAQTNFLPLIVDTLSQVMKVEGYRAARAPQNARPWETLWQPNQLDARQTGVHRSALAYGVSYVTVTPGDPSPVLRGVSPRQMTAVYADPGEDEWPLLALRDDGQMLRLYDEESVYFLTKPGDAPGAVDLIERRDHDLGVCPVIRFRDRMLLDGDEQMGVIEPILSIQERIDETVFGLLVAQYYSAFKQRYVIGWMPDDEAESFRASASQLWTFDDSPEQVKVGEFAETNLSGYLDSKDAGIKDMAAISQVPPQNFALGGVSNLSAEALASLEAGKDRKADEITTSLGESWEQVLRLGAAAAGDNESAQDTSAQVRWKDATARSLAQTVDAVGKMVQMLGFPREMAFELIPGLSDQDVERAVALSAEGDAVAQLARMLDTQAPEV